MSVFLKVLISCVAIAVGVAGIGLHRIGAWGIVFPSDVYETRRPALAEDFGRNARLRILLYTKTNSFRHIEGIAAVHSLFERIAGSRRWSVFETENSAVFDREMLDRFDVVVFANASGNHASDDQDRAFQEWLERGGGWFGIHAAGDGSHAAWTWYEKNLKSGEYLGHILGPQKQEARVVVEAVDHPVTRGLPLEIFHEEEWYSWSRGARQAGFEVLMTVDESTYSPKIVFMGTEKDIAMGDHPVVWSRCVESGAAVYSAMGHWGAAYERDFMERLIVNAVEWVGGETGCGS